jgi:hypothetical protein
VAASSFALSSVVSIVLRRLRNVIVVCVNVCVAVCVTRRLRHRQLRRSKHSGNRRRMLGMDIAMDRANLVCKDIESNARDGRHYIMKRGALRQQMRWHIFGKNTATTKSKQNQQKRG